MGKWVRLYAVKPSGIAPYRRRLLEEAAEFASAPAAAPAPTQQRPAGLPEAAAGPSFAGHAPAPGPAPGPAVAEFEVAESGPGGRRRRFRRLPAGLREVRREARRLGLGEPEHGGMQDNSTDGSGAVVPALQAAGTLDVSAREMTWAGNVQAWCLKHWSHNEKKDPSGRSACIVRPGGPLSLLPSVLHAQAYLYGNNVVDSASGEHTLAALQHELGGRCIGLTHSVAQTFVALSISKVQAPTKAHASACPIVRAAPFSGERIRFVSRYARGRLQAVPLLNKAFCLLWHQHSGKEQGTPLCPSCALCQAGQSIRCQQKCLTSAQGGGSWPWLGGA